MNPLEQLEFTTRVVKRAQYEAFEFELAPKGVTVRNCSHVNPPDHEYLVTIADGLPMTCTCPADTQFDGACKHRLAVAIREPLLEAARAQQIAADGGTATSPLDDEVGIVETDATGDDCDCPDLPDEFPCWECVRTGRRSLPD